MSALVAEGPVLLALFLSPLVLGFQDPVPALLVACLIWASVLLRTLVPGQPAFVRPRVWWLTLSLPLLAVLSLATSTNRGGTVLYVMLAASQVGMLWCVADIAARGGAGRVVGVLLAGALCTAGLGLREWGLHARDGDFSWRAFGPFTSQNFFAGYLTPALLLTLGVAWRPATGFRAGTWMLVTGILAGALCGGLMVTGSRGGMLSLAAGSLALVATGLWQRTLRGREPWKHFGVVAVAAAVVFATFAGGIERRYAAKAGGAAPTGLCPKRERSEAVTSSQFRLATWQGTLRMGLTRPLTGWGAGGFETAFAGHAVAGYTRHAHSSYLQLLAELGVPGLLAWLALLTAAAWSLLRAPGEPWRAGVMGALVATGLHNAIDSLLIVPAIGLLLGAMLGLALAGSPGGAAPAETGAVARGSRRRPGHTPRWRWLPAVLCGAMLGLSLSHALGRSLLNQAATLRKERHWQQAVDALTTAQALIPWDAQVADAQRVAYAFLGRREDSIAAAQRALRLTPERPPAYLFLGRLREDLEDNPALALAQYDVGLEHFPNEIDLLAARARVLERLGERSEALKVYRHIVEVDESPVGQLAALTEFKDYRVARARLALAQNALVRGSVDEAFALRRSGACLLAERRRLFDTQAASYFAVAPPSRALERELRLQEMSLWRDLAPEFRRRGDPTLADLAEKEADSTEATLDKVDEMFDSLERNGGMPE